MADAQTTETMTTILAQYVGLEGPLLPILQARASAAAGLRRLPHLAKPARSCKRPSRNSAIAAPLPKFRAL